MTGQVLRRFRGFAVGGLGAAWLVALSSGVSAETLESALARAYGGNPTLNAQRASVRATDENVPRAKSLSRPRINATADAGAAYSESSAPGLEGEAATAALRSLNSANNATAAGGAGGVGGTGGRVGRSSVSRTLPRGFGVQVDQTLFNGFRTENSIRQAESQVLGARETLRNTEQDVLFQAAQFYMNVLRDTARLSLQRNNVEVLEEQLRQTRDRFNVGEVTRTDVAQAESRLALARSQVSVAESDLRTSIAQFRQIIGVEPRQLAPGRPVDRLVPGSIDSAIAIAMDEHPNIKSAMHAVDAAELQVKVTEGELLPSVTLSGAASQRYDTGQQGAEAFSAQLVARLTVPIYEGGEVYARARQAKEIAGQRRIDVETARDAVRATLIQSWGQLEAAKAQIIATQAQVQAAEIALNGVREEARVGQRTTLDVLNAQQELLNARVNLIIAQRDRVVFSYAVARSIGRLTTRVLGLNVAQYSAKQHFDQVKDLWGGLRIPDGR